VKFNELDLHPALSSAISQLGFENLTPIQEASFQTVVEGKDIAGLAQTGTGKTAAFLIPLIQRLLLSKSNGDDRLQTSAEDSTSGQGEEKDPRVFPNWTPNNFLLVLVPTRELAEQVNDNVEKLGGQAGLKAAVVIGGASYEKQRDLINDGVDFIVSTPGRLIDLYKENIVDLKQVRGVIFDEADRMFDMGFKDDMRYVLERIPRERQYLCYSATLDFEVLNTAYEFGSEPVEVSISKDEPTADNVEDKIFHVGQDEKPQFLLSLLKKHKPRQAIVFTNFKHNVDRVADFLNKNEVKAKGISSLLSQKQRQRVMDWFKSAEDLKVMVATDVAARGLDIKGVDLVINYEVPDEASTYVHRIGRTGRAEASGIAFSLVSDRDIASLSRVETYLGEKLEVEWLEDSEMVKDFEEFPREARTRRLHNSMDKRKREAGKRRSGGGRDRDGDRDKKRRNSNGQRPKKKRHDHKKAKGSSEQEQEANAEAGSPMHRDRKSGRHDKKDRQKSGANNKRRNSKNNSRKKSASGSKNKKHRVRSSSNKAARTNTASQSVGGKVKSFIKNLFS
tara:strand:+ start:14999 stop:16684 length:1686 start_codon:yes stop_codon:yes gene_type:complete